jgi:hypothetical protein
VDRLDGKGLLALRKQLVRDLVAPPDSQPKVAAALASYPFHPHVSLLYGSLPQRLRERLAAQYDLQGRKLLFDRIAAVRPAPGRAGLSEVADWVVGTGQRLRGR